VSALTIVGLILWGLAIIFASIKIEGKTVSNPITRLVVIAFLFPFTGVLFVAIGFVGLVLLSPVLHALGIDWTFVITP